MFFNNRKPKELINIKGVIALSSKLSQELKSAVDEIIKIRLNTKMVSKSYQDNEIKDKLFNEMHKVVKLGFEEVGSIYTVTRLLFPFLLVPDSGKLYLARMTTNTFDTNLEKITEIVETVSQYNMTSSYDYCYMNFIPVYLSLENLLQISGEKYNLENMVKLFNRFSMSLTYINQQSLIWIDNIYKTRMID